PDVPPLRKLVPQLPDRERTEALAWSSGPRPESSCFHVGHRLGRGQPTDRNPRDRDVSSESATSPLLFLHLGPQGYFHRDYSLGGRLPSSRRSHYPPASRQSRSQRRR